jgi:CRP/FNR family transcriptional regulator
MKNTEIIKNLSFFSQLSEEDLQKVANISIDRNYKKNMIIFIEGEPGDAFYFIKSGKIKVFRTYEDGKEHIYPYI